jgi:hypothetical protein
MKSKLNSVKIFKLSNKFGIEWYIKCPYLAKNKEKKFWSIWAKFGKKWSIARKIFTENFA